MGLALAALPSARAQTIRADTAAMVEPGGKTAAFSVKAGIPVRALGRQGFWVQIEAGGRAAWVKASALSFSAGSGIPVAIDTGRLGRGNIVATSAARGLSAKDILGGIPRLDEVRRLAGFTAEAAAIQDFVAQGSVQPPARATVLHELPATTRVAAETAKPGATVGAVTPSPGKAAQPSDSDAW